MTEQHWIIAATFLLMALMIIWLLTYASWN